MSDFTAQSIKWHRKNKGMTQAELAAAVGVSLMSIRRYETLGDGNREPSADLFDKIAEQLDTTSDILRGKVVNYDFKDVPQGPVTNAEATKAYFTKKNAPTTIAAHFDGDEYTEEELDEIIKKLKTSSKAEEGLAILKQLTDDLPGHAEQMISYGKSLLESIDKLNDEGQQKVKDYADDLADNPKYRK